MLQNSGFEIWLHNRIVWETEKETKKYALPQDQLNQNLWVQGSGFCFIKKLPSDFDAGQG